MLTLIGSLITSLAVSVFIFPILIKYSKKKKIFDVPGHRRIHSRVTPSIGGVAIFFGFFTASILWVNFVNWHEFKILHGILFMSCLLGLCDDLVHIKPSVKILGQVIAGSLAFFLLDIRLSSLYGLFSDAPFTLWISYPLTVFTIIIISNSFNLIDGIDGLAGAFATLALVSFSVWFYLTGDVNYSILCCCLLGSILAFLIFNWEPSKIFMGDTGALLIGMMLSILTIRFINSNYQLPITSPFKFSSSVLTAMCVIIIPLIDTVRIILIRVSKGISPLTPDKRHIHHTLVRVGMSHARAVLVISFVHVFFLVGALLMMDFSDGILAGFVITAAVGFNLILNYFALNKI
jgi:UDP-N-acetylmuramyl pentapeptide phosphotransferase/UDP-N-acetylglucosamine-1-phosphate transferase